MITIELSLEGLTLDQLRKFVEVAVAAGAPNDAEVFGANSDPANQIAIDGIGVTIESKESAQ